MGWKSLQVSELQLGELQSAFAVFITALSEYARFMKQDYIQRNYVCKKNN